MGLIEAVLYGLVQGITEYLPISSSAHLILLPKILGSQDPGLAFDVFLHLGTLLATLFYFRSDWVLIMRDKVRLSQVIAGTIPALVAGVIFHDLAETVFRSPQVLVATLSLGGIALYAGDRLAPMTKSAATLTIKDAFLIGLFQCLALVPGVSRSGSTILGARLVGVTRPEAARFSFLLSAPITAAALVFEFRNWSDLLAITDGGGVLLVAALSALIFGCLAITGIIRYVKNFGYGVFALYRIILAFIVFYSFA